METHDNWAMVRVVETYFVTCPKCKNESKTDDADFDMEYVCPVCKHESNMHDF